MVSTMVHEERAPASRTKAAARLVGTAFVLCASLALAWVAFSVAPSHLSSIGFAARNRQPNRFLYWVHNGVGVVGVGNALLVVVDRVSIAAVLLVPLTLASALLYLATW